MDDNRKYLKKGLWLGIVLCALQKIICFVMYENPRFDDSAYYFIGVAFGIIVLMFLMTDKIKNLFITGFTGLFVLIGIEVVIWIIQLGTLLYGSFGKWLEVYFVGFLGSMAGTAIAIVLVLTTVKFNLFSKREAPVMAHTAKLKLLIYALVSAMGFAYLVLPENAGISVPVFAILQFVCLAFIVPDKKRLWLFIPIFILSLNSFISGNSIWRVPNVIIGIILYSVMFLDFNLFDTTAKFLKNILQSVAEPVAYFDLPFKWAAEANKEKAALVKRILTALAVTIPAIIVLTVILSFADMIFGEGVSNMIEALSHAISFNVAWKLVYGAAVGLYLFGLYSAHLGKRAETPGKPARQGDLIILNSLLTSVLALYTVFMVIQFKYLFAVVQLPFGLSYTDYARRGFFELLFLTGVNIFMILLTVYLTKEKTRSWHKLTKYLCGYLCFATIVLLASSFYRMWLYNADDGLTRMRFLVFGFLIFECIGLLITFFYIFKPKFNILAVYCCVGLTYYLLLNLVPMDYFIAKSQADMYLNGERTSVDYALTLSTDAAPQIERLIGSDADVQAKYYFENHRNFYTSIPQRWQRYNLSVHRAVK